MADTGKDTKEYQVLKRCFSKIVDTLGNTMDPAGFARKLGEKSLISDDIVQAASVIGVLTGPQRTAPVMQAVLAQVKLKSDLFHTFMDILRRENDVLWKCIQQHYCNCPLASEEPETNLHRPGDQEAKARDLPTKILTERNRRKMRSKFQSLVARISITLDQVMSMELDEQSGKTRFQRFREYVAGVFNDSAMQKTRTVGQIFGIIRDRKYWDMDGSPYDLLLLLMEEVDDADLMSHVEKGHVDYYTQYLVATKVVDHVFEHKGDKPEDYKPNFIRLSMKLDKIKVDDCSMAYLVDLWKAVKCCVQLPNLFSVLMDIEEGCVSVMWLVPMYAVPALMRLPRSSPDLFSKFSILRMTINGICFYKATSTAVSSAKPQDKDEDSFPPSTAPPQESVPSPQTEQQQLLDSKQPTVQEGYDVELIHDTGIYNCLVCHLIPRDPMQISCCGKIFCRACIKRVLSKNKAACPHCQDDGVTKQVWEDDGHRQTILKLKVYCPNKKQGCDWTGEIFHLDNHVNAKPVEGTESNGCQHLELTCIHCSDYHPRHHMHTCPLQRYTCPYCNHYSASYEELTGRHVSECDKFLIPCPLCDRKVVRRNLNLHKTKCLGRKLSQDTVKHLKTAAAIVPPNPDSAVPLLAIVETDFCEFVPPPSFTMTNFSKHKSKPWRSRSFYSHIGGYKMCLMVFADGYGGRAGTHLSVFVCLMRGEYDDDLLWPFRGDITFQLVNCRSDKGHIECTTHFDHRTTDSAAGRVTVGELAPDGQCTIHFIPHSNLHYNESWNTQYLFNNDSLVFKVTKVEVDNQLQVISPQPPISGEECMAPVKHSTTAVQKIEKETTTVNILTNITVEEKRELPRDLDVLPSPQAEQQQQQPASQEGYNVEVVDDKGTYGCLICHLILRDPIQVGCCGKRYCQVCLTKFLSERNTCPHCQAKQDTFSKYEDKNQRQIILALKIYCSNKRQGCTWTGERCYLEKHLNSDSAVVSHEECQYVELTCVHCTERHPRHHISNCPLQQYTCQYCNYSASYINVMRCHVLECEKFPVLCPFCGEREVRMSLHLHKAKCQSQGSAKQLVGLPSPVLVFVPPPTFTMTNFSQYKVTGNSWESSPFYSHIGGYKMCLVVYAAGEFHCNTRALILVTLMRGEYDDTLKWPFRGEIMLRLVNQRADDKHEHVKVTFDDSASDSVAGQVTEGKRAPEGNGGSIPNSILDYNELMNTEYLKNDILVLSVTGINVLREFNAGKEQTSKTSSGKEKKAVARTSITPDVQLSSDLVHSDQSQQRPFSPVTIIMSGFISWKMRGIPWYSSPFYSHKRGYKMCLRVVANSWGDNAGTHVAVHIIIMRGEYDDDLLWPFRGDIIVKLLNHVTNEGHVMMTVCFDSKVSDRISSRVTEQECAPDGLGHPKFISHSALCERNSAYLDKDILTFQVTSVIVYSTEPCL